MAPPTTSSQPYTTGSSKFSPDALLQLTDTTRQHLSADDFRSAIITAFSLPSTDEYVYHATASVTLTQVQTAINAGSAHGLHAWYVDSSGTPTSSPSNEDIGAYMTLFDPTKATTNTLRGLVSNAKKDSLRARVMTHLSTHRHLDSSITPPKRKAAFVHHNPYLDFWAWSCKNLEYAGPDANTVRVRSSHHVLPVFMHHFGCVVPSHEALEVVKRVSEYEVLVAAKAGKMVKTVKTRTVLDIGSGNGYWTYMLRRQGLEDVVAVDNMQSKWRTCWIGDTVITDGVGYIKNKRPEAGKDDVLLLVYPVVGGDFTSKVIEAYRGDVICVVGTQNGNGYTGFKNEMVDQWMDKNKKDFERVVQIALPSFAGKDDALFVFRRRKTENSN